MPKPGDDMWQMHTTDGVPEPLVAVLVSMYRAVDNGEFARVTGDVEHLTGRPAQTVQTYLNSVL